MVRAPKRFVIAAAHEPPKIPRVENKNTAIVLSDADHVYCPSPLPLDIYSSYVPSDRKKKSIPLFNSPSWNVAISISIKEKLYSFI